MTARRLPAIRRLALATALAIGALLPRRADAQANTAELLANAVKLYEDLQVERAVVLLRQVVSPSSPYEVSREQRVQAYKYLGAALAVLGQRDSAVVYLRAAIERDPFVDLDPQQFTPTERAALADARARTFAVAARPIAPAAIDPRTERATFTVLTTHAARVAVSVHATVGGGSAVLLEGESDGLREIPWNGVLADGRLAPPGRYALIVHAQSAITGRSDSAQVWFDVQHDRPALEDSLPVLGPADLLPERLPRSETTKDLMRGLGVATAALLTPSIVGDRRLGGSGRYAMGAAVLGVSLGTASFIIGQRHRDIPANVTENRRRLAERARQNAEIAGRNAERVALTRLVLRPAAGVGP